MHLVRLEQSGRHVADTFSASDVMPAIPEGFDLEKFNRGKIFFQKNVFSCTLSMLTSLISGLSVNNLLRPLVFTEQSDSAIKSIRRYARTFQHVLLWHYGNVWDPSTKAHASIAKVRVMHNSVRAEMMDKKPHTLWVSQYDMSLVQCGFMGAIVMYPDSTGIQYTNEDLSDYCYFWYGIGYLLGISDENNICKGDLAETLSICREIETDILLPALRSPPQEFVQMAEALIDGMNLPFRFRLFSLEAFLAISFSTMSAPYPKRLSFADYLRTLFLRSFVVLVKYVPYCRYLLNKLFTPRINMKTISWKKKWVCETQSTELISCDLKMKLSFKNLVCVNGLNSQCMQMWH